MVISKLAIIEELQNQVTICKLNQKTHTNLGDTVAAEQARADKKALRKVIFYIRKQLDMAK